jgi:hypothetical protein
MLPAAPPKTSGLAVASLVLAVLSLPLFGCCCNIGLLPAALAVVFGHVARSQIRRSPGALEGDGMAVAGLVIGYVSIGVQLLLTVIMVLWIMASAAIEHHHIHPPRWTTNI